MKQLLLKTFKVITTSAAVLLMTMSSYGQKKNIAPDAATNCQGSGGVTPYCWNWNRINDKGTGTCGSQEAFVWTTAPANGSEWMEWVWTSSKVIDEVKIYHAQTTGRFLTGGVIQKWTGSAWVDHYTFSGLSQSNCENTIKFTPFSSTGMRIAKFVAGTGQNSNMNYREIEIFEIPAPLNAGMLNLSSPSNTCTSLQDIAASLSNNGINRIDSAVIDWSINGTMMSTIKYNMYPNFKLSDTLASGQNKKITLATNYALTDYTNYTFKIWSSLPNGKADTINGDDTLTSKLNFLGSPTNPTTTDIKRCGVGTVQLTATPGDAKDVVLWWNKPTGGTSIGEGKTITSPFLWETDSFYAEAIRAAQTTEFGNGFNGGTIVTASTNDYNGGMFDMTIGTSTIMLDSLLFRTWQFIPGTTYELYYKKGGFNGFTTNASAWTKLSDGAGDCYQTGNGNILAVRNLKLILEANAVYGFYFTTSPTTGNDIYLNNGNTAYSNGDITLQGGSVMWGQFGSTGVYTTWSVDVRAGYRKTCPSSGRAKSVVTVVPLATGATMMQSTPFEGTYRTGTKSGADYAIEGKTNSYELRTPTKFTNSTFGSLWYISSLSMGTVNGTPIPTGDTTLVLPGANNGKLTYKPTWGWADSTIRILVNIFDISTGCDTTLERYIFVAPTPRTNFSVKNGCLGTPLEFLNKSTISSGFMTYFWDFDDGETSDFESPVHNYANYGRYRVKLTATSSLGVSKDTIIEIEVFEIPDVKFDVLNACDKTAIKFTNKTTISSGTLQYDWNFGDGKTSIAPSPSHLYAAPGGYKVTLTATANGCTNSLTKNATQFAKPVASFTNNGDCALKQVSFVNTSTIALGEKIGTMWNFGDGDLGTVINNTHVYATEGTKTVKLIAISQFGCLDSIIKNIVIKPTPIADFSYDKVCDVDPVNFTNTSKEPVGVKTIYSWTFGDGGTSIQASPSYKYKTLGPKVITLLATGANGCYTEIQKEVEVLVQPIADFNATSNCSGQPVTFINNSKVSKGEISYKWTFGDGDSSFKTAPVKIYNTVGSKTYTVVLRATVEGGCTDVESKTVDISESPVCGFTAKMDAADRSKWTFTPNNTTYGPTAYTWYFEGSGRSNTQVATHSFDYTDTKYRVFLSVITQDGCNCVDSSNYITTSWPVGINNLTNQGLSVYPNPSNGKITIEMQNWQSNETATVNVIDATGKTVYQEQINNNLNGKANLQLSGMAEGVYQIQVTRAGQINTSRIVIQH
jgi:PKD repeat protein